MQLKNVAYCMRRLLAILLLFMLAPSAGSASDKIFCDCEETACICFIQKGDEGPYVSAVIKLLKSKGYCEAWQKVSILDEGAVQGIIALQKKHDLPQTGMLDDETLTLLIFDMLPDALDAADPLSCGDYNWIPTDGGKKRHIDSLCCNMYAPAESIHPKCRGFGIHQLQNLQ